MNATFASKPQSSLPKSSLQALHDKNHSITRPYNFQISNLFLENHIGSVIVLNESGEVIYATENLRDQLSETTDSQPTEDQSLRQKVALIGEMMGQCRDRFPQQNWVLELDIFTQASGLLRIRSRWLKLEASEHPCILLIVENRQQFVQDMVLNEAQTWGLTAREQEVWLLHREGQTYRQIATRLFITINTVKKHMRSIHGKQKVHGAA